MENILEAPRGQRKVWNGRCYNAPYKCDPTAAIFPCVGDVCTGQGGAMGTGQPSHNGTGKVATPAPAPLPPLTPPSTPGTPLGSSANPNLSQEAGGGTSPQSQGSTSQDPVPTSVSGMPPKMEIPEMRRQ
ncbi:MAG: hypothetical protein WHU94_00410 [Thermogemmata sp.]